MAIELSEKLFPREHKCCNNKDFISSLMLYLDCVRRSCWQKRGELPISLWSCAFSEGVGLFSLTPQLRALESQRQTTKEQKQKHKDFLLFVKTQLTFSKNLGLCRAVSTFCMVEKLPYDSLLFAFTVTIIQSYFDNFYKFFIMLMLP